MQEEWAPSPFEAFCCAIKCLDSLDHVDQNGSFDFSGADYHQSILSNLLCFPLPSVVGSERCLRQWMVSEVSVLVTRCGSHSPILLSMRLTLYLENESDRGLSSCQFVHA